jgi:hypothetical protein
MVNIPVIKLIFVLCVLLFVVSCTTQKGAVRCPSFEVNEVNKIKKDKNRAPHRHMEFRTSIKKRNWYQKKGALHMYKQMKSTEILTQISGDTNSTLVVSALEKKSVSTIYKHDINNVVSGNNEHDTIKSNIVNIQQAKENQINNSNMKNSSTLEINNKLSDAYSVAENKHKKERKTARIIGGALLLMAVLAGISIPSVGTLGASIGLVGVFLLDIAVSIGIIKYHKKEKPKLAKASGILRLIYTAFLGVGIGHLFAGNVRMFNDIWGLGLIMFGIHLITLGVLFNNNERKKWVNILIKSLLITAGIGYIIQYVGILMVPNPVGFVATVETIFILPMILGEVSYALWMLIQGGKAKGN